MSYCGKNAEEPMWKHARACLYHQAYFNELLAIERRRCARSQDRVLLMLADLSDLPERSERMKIADMIMEVLPKVTRETDVKGWHEHDSVIGVLFTEITGKDTASRFALRHLVHKCPRVLSAHLGTERFSRIKIRWHVLPAQSTAQPTVQHLSAAHR